MFFYVTLVTYYTRQHNYVKGLTLADILSQNMKTLPDFLTQNYLNWQAAEGERKTLEDFANYLNVNRSLLSFWINGARIPSEENVERIAAKLGNEVFDILNLPRPTPEGALRLAKRIKADLHAEDPITVRQTLLGIIHEITADRNGNHIIGRLVYYHAPTKKKAPNETVSISRPPVGAPIYKHSTSFEGTISSRGRPKLGR